MRAAATTALGLLVASTLAAATYGDGVTVAEPTPLAELAADPARFDGETVRVEGAVSAVCEMKGCWMLLVDGDAEVRVKVPDDLIVFPAAAVGERAAAQGTVGVAELDRESWVAWQRHLAEEAGLPFHDHSIGDGPFLRVEIAATGAEIPVPGP